MAANGSPENDSGSLNSFTGGKLFDTVFARGMALVEEKHPIWMARAGNTHAHCRAKPGLPIRPGAWS
tara:strand:- start:383 stop:583 length:201 start_codon:yes stop_codon:yes gene_type:complete